MIIRLVKMHFSSAYADEFKTTFNAVQPKIASFKGCSSVQLLRDSDSPDIFFTISHWLDAEHLETYRKSELFTKTWAMVKPNFQSKPEAWSLLVP